MSTSIFLTKIAKFYAKAKKWFFEVFIPKRSNEYLPGALRPSLLFCYSSVLLLIKIAAISFVLLLPYSTFFSTITQDRLVTLINQARQKNNLSPVSLNITLNETADFKVNDMLANGYFEHTSPAGATPWSWFKKAGYNYAYAGENLAINFAETDDVFSAWMNSPAHRDNILNPNFNEIGLAVKNGSLQDHDATLAVLVFGKQQAAKTGQPSITQNQSSAPKTTPKAQVSPKPSAAPATLKTSKTPTPSIKSTPTRAQPSLATPSPSVSILPSASLALPASPSLGGPNQIIAEKDNIELQSIAGETAENFSINVGQTSIPESLSLASNKWTPKVLGAFASKTDEVTKSLYLYFTLFLTLALIVNIFVKIEIQYWQTIFSTTLVILLSSALIFI